MVESDIVESPLKSKNALIFKVLAILFAVCVLVVLGCGFYYQSLIISSNSLGEVSFKISSGESVSAIANRLQNEKIINSAVIFRLHIKLSGLDNKIQAGDYTIMPNATIVSLAELFQHGTNDVKLTFIEGWRLEQFAKYADEQLDSVLYDEFMQAAQDKEGFLFPDTYFVSGDIDATALVHLLAVTFDERVQPLFSQENLQRVDLSPKEVVILASLIEREAKSFEDRKVIAGILLKRLREGMRLEVDATTQYVVGNSDDWWPHDLTLDDLNNESPFNTRVNFGLPPSPISSVSLDAITAVIFSQESPYYFYLTDTEGKMHYAETLDQHINNISLYL